VGSFLLSARSVCAACLGKTTCSSVFEILVIRHDLNGFLQSWAMAFAKRPKLGPGLANGVPRNREFRGGHTGRDSRVMEVHGQGQCSVAWFSSASKGHVVEGKARFASGLGCPGPDSEPGGFASFERLFGKGLRHPRITCQNDACCVFLANHSGSELARTAFASG